MTEGAQPARSQPFPQPDDVFQLRVSLMGIKPPIWRRVLVPQDVTLAQLHAILQIVMGWTNSHLHQFKVGDVVFAEPHQEYEPGPIDHRRITLNQIAPRRGSTCVYEYDFGDSWRHDIVLEAIETGDLAYPRCTDGEGRCPPEDVGGISGYEHLKRVIADPGDAEHTAMLEWLGLESAREFDAAAFDLARANAAMAGVPAARIL